MSELDKKLARFRVFYYDEERGPDVVKCGNYEFGQAQEKFGEDAQGSRSITASTFAVWLGARRGKVSGADVAFEEWNKTVALVDPFEDDESSGESPAPPAT